MATDVSKDDRSSPRPGALYSWMTDKELANQVLAAPSLHTEMERTLAERLLARDEYAEAKLDEMQSELYEMQSELASAAEATQAISDRYDNFTAVVQDAIAAIQNALTGPN